MRKRLVSCEYETISGRRITVRAPQLRPRQAAFWRCFFYVSAIFAIGLYAYAPDAGSILLPIYAIVLILLFHRNKKGFFERSAHEVLQTDSRLPILYLRSFKSDLSFVEFFSFRYGSFDEALCASFETVGPVVVIGKPTEKGSSGLGAARLYVSDKDWQVVVQDLMQRAQAVIIRAGVTPGLRWELSEAFRRLKPEQVILFLTFGWGLSESREDKYQRFVAWAQQFIVKPLPEQIDGAFLVYFDNEWNPHLLDPHANGNRFDEYSETDQGEALKLRDAFHSHPLAAQLDKAASSTTFLPPDLRQLLPFILFIVVLIVLFVFR